MNLLAIDPGSNKVGIALFKNKKLVATQTLHGNQDFDSQRKRVKLAYDTFLWLEEVFSKYEIDPNLQNSYEVVCEEPLLQGKSNTPMQRFLGALEELYQGRLNYLHPMTIKARMGRGTLDKMEVAVAAGERLTTENEKELVADAIYREAFDETDAVAIGLVHMEKLKNGF